MVIVILIITIFIQQVYFKNKVEKLNEERNLEIKFSNAIMDTLDIYKNKYSEEVAEKLSLQYDLIKLRFKIDSVGSINDRLLNRINGLEQKNNIISAALIQSRIIIDSLENITPIIEDDKITFIDSTEYLTYRIEIDHVIPSDTLITPSLNIYDLIIPNEQFIEFHWEDNKKIGYPISFSVTNTNPYIKTTDISSYIIPEINKSNIKPSTFEKIKDFLNSNGLIAVGATGLVFGTLYILK